MPLRPPPSVEPVPEPERVPEPEPLPEPELPGVPLELAGPEPEAAPVPLGPDFVDDRAAVPPPDDRRSTFAQPEPLKTIAGAVRAFRIEPSAPQLGQNRGPSSLIPWMTSVTRPQAPHV